VFSEPGSAREEAERLVAAGLAFASLAAQAHPEIATGSAACCVCPLCKLIEAVRDPDPQVVERIATGAGDLAAGMAGLLRSLSAMARPPAEPWSSATSGTEPADRAARSESATGPGGEAGPASAAAVVKKAVAKKAVKKAVPRTVPEPGTVGGPKDGVESALTAPKPLAKKAVAKKAIKKAMPKPSPGASG
jgi:hypothetical protein